jgi:hypothetical protein
MKLSCYRETYNTNEQTYYVNEKKMLYKRKNLLSRSKTQFTAKRSIPQFVNPELYDFCITCTSPRLRWSSNVGDLMERRRLERLIGEKDAEREHVEAVADGEKQRLEQVGKERILTES